MEKYIFVSPKILQVPVRVRGVLAAVPRVPGPGLPRAGRRGGGAEPGAGHGAAERGAGRAGAGPGAAAAAAAEARPAPPGRPHSYTCMMQSVNNFLKAQKHAYRITVLHV